MSSASADQESLANYDAAILTDKHIEKIDALVIDAVFGYIRNIESSLHRKHIPTEVALICLSYYWINDNEYFANAHSNYNVINSEDEISVVQTVYDSNCSAFGNVSIPSQFGRVYTWNFKLFRDSPMLQMYIGITTEYEDTDVMFYLEEEKGHNYSMDEEGTLYKNGDEISRCSAMSIPYGHFSELTMTLDLNQRTLNYADEYEHHAIEDITCGPDVNYKMAVSTKHEHDEYCEYMYSIDNKIQLIEFCIKDWIDIDGDEYFANAHSDYCTVNSENEISVEQTVQDSECSAFGNVLIPSQFGGVYTWKFKIFRESRRTDIYIGITTEYEDTDVMFNLEEEKGHNYSINEEGSLYKNGEEISCDSGISMAYGQSSEVTMTMTLDLNQKTLNYEYEHVRCGIEDIICGPGINYKMAVCVSYDHDELGKYGNKIELIEFCVKD